MYNETDEIIDIVDQNDNIIGTQSRNKTYGKDLDENQYIRYINVLIFNLNDELLLPKRSSNRRLFPNCYDFSCGEHLQSGESYNRAAIRGLEEELGLRNPGLENLGKLGPDDGVSGFMQVYRSVTEKTIFDFDKNGIESLEWYPLKKVMEMVKDSPDSFKADFLPVINWYCKSTEK